MPDHGLLYTLSNVHDSLADAQVDRDDKWTNLSDAHNEIALSVNNTHADLDTAYSNLTNDHGDIENSVATAQNVLHQDHATIEVAVASLSQQLGDPRPASPNVLSVVLDNFNTVEGSLSSLLADLAADTASLQTDHVTISAAVASARSALLAAISAEIATLSADVTAAVAPLLGGSDLSTLNRSRLQTGASGAGSVAVPSTTVALVYTVTAYPTSAGTDGTVYPLRLFHLGWFYPEVALSAGATAPLVAWLISQEVELLPLSARPCTAVSWDLRPGVVVNVDAIYR